jgi:sugar transferase (PEP-CTERM/EpsH1 system associated)
MRILFVVPYVPSVMGPRAYNFIRRLSRSHDVSVLCLSTTEAEERFASEFRRHCQNLEVIRLPRWRNLWNCLVALFSSRALRCAYFYSPHLRRRVQEKVNRKEVDLIHAEHVKSIPMVSGVVGKIPIVFDAVDCYSLLEARRRKVFRNPLFKLFSWTESKKISYWENRSCQLVDRIVISSPVDKEQYPTPEGLRERIEVIPNAVDLEHFRFGQFEPQKNLIVFCAKLDYFPNQDAALYFSKSIWPLLLARRPELRFEIVGNRPPRSVRELDGKNNIRVVGSVPDVRPYAGRAWVLVCPIRVRTGTQFKILQTMALGAPVVTTRVCCPGLAVEPGKHLLVADTPEEFASAVELLLDNPTLRANLVQAGREYVEQHHDWNASAARLSQVYAEATGTLQKAERQATAFS